MIRLHRPGWMVAALLAGCLVFPLPATAGAGDAFATARRIQGEPPLDPASPVWLELPAAAITLYPQASVPPATGEKPLAAKLRALYGGKAIAIHIEWADAGAARERHIGKFADAVALQWPKNYGPGRALPYVGMGHAGSPVALWLWRADGSVETLAAEGFGTLTRQAPDGVQARGTWKDGTWRVVFRRALAVKGGGQAHFAPSRQGLVPLAVAVWNGEAAGRDGIKRLSAWQILRFEKGKAGDAYAGQSGELAVTGDAGRGMRLMSEHGCAACHSFPANPAQPRIGPDLGHAGGIHSAAYLRESLAEPSRVVVPGKAYYTMQDGKQLSLMPPFAGTEAERDDILAYLMSLR